MLSASRAGRNDLAAFDAPSPPAHDLPDPMAELGFADVVEDALPPPAITGAARKAKRKASHNRLVQVEAPAKCREMHPGCKETRQVKCYVQCSGKRQVWISLDDVPWLVRVLHDQATLGGVPLFDISETPPPALAGGEAAGEPLVEWDFTASAWEAEGRQLKPDGVSPEDAAALGVDAEAWRAFSYKEKKLLAYDVMVRSLGQF